MSEQANEQVSGATFERFVKTIKQLRAPSGCPWDKVQTHSSIARNMIEEAHEAVEAIERKDTDDLCEELGDVLLQVVLQAQIAADANEFNIADVIEGVNNKMIRRHPHVFGDEAALAAANLSPDQLREIRETATPNQVLDLWDQIKLFEKKQKSKLKIALGATGTTDVTSETNDADAVDEAGLLDSIPRSLPALMQAQDISRKVVAAGFEWPDVASVWDQVDSEMEEYRAEDKGSNRAEEEFGDLLFSLINVARKEGIDAESALLSSCRKFRARWAIMEGDAQKAKKHISSYTTEELEALWSKAKQTIEIEQRGGK